MQPQQTPITDQTPAPDSPLPASPPTPTQPPELMPTLSEQVPRRNFDGLKSLLSTLAILICAPLIALALTAFIFQSYEVDGPSMETTLQNQDRLIIWKVPRTIARITNNSYIPNRGDIIVFAKSGLNQFGGSGRKQLIKRVIGLPGERVVVQDSVLTVYNDEYPDGFQPDKTLPYGSNVPPTTSGNVDIIVPAGEVFVCGDNRSNSLDSRSFGTVAANDIVGELVMRVFPFNKAKVF